MEKPKLKRRNPVARSPLLRKGGAHVKSKTGQRLQARLATHQAVDEWLDELDENNTQEHKNGEPKLPVFFVVSPTLAFTFQDDSFPCGDGAAKIVNFNSASSSKRYSGFFPDNFSLSVMILASTKIHALFVSSKLLMLIYCSDIVHMDNEHPFINQMPNYSTT